MTANSNHEWTKEELTSWMDRQGLNQTQASGILICSQAMVSKMCSGHAKISKRTVAFAMTYETSRICKAA